MRKIITPENKQKVLDALPCLQSEIWKKYGWDKRRTSELIRHMMKEGIIKREMDDKIIGGTFHISKSKQSV